MVRSEPSAEKSKISECFFRPAGDDEPLISAYIAASYCRPFPVRVIDPKWVFSAIETSGDSMIYRSNDSACPARGTIEKMAPSPLICQIPAGEEASESVAVAIESTSITIGKVACAAKARHSVADAMSFFPITEC